MVCSDPRSWWTLAQAELDSRVRWKSALGCPIPYEMSQCYRLFGLFLVVSFPGAFICSWDLSEWFHLWLLDFLLGCMAHR
jgi:hypothetical protein